MVPSSRQLSDLSASLRPESTVYSLITSLGMFTAADPAVANSEDADEESDELDSAPPTHVRAVATLTSTRH